MKVDGVVALGGRARWAVIALGAVAAVDLVAAGSSWLELGLIDRVVSGEPVSFAEVEASDSRRSLIGFLSLAVQLATVVLFMRWFAAAYRNLAALGAGERRFDAGWAIGAWIVPFVSFVRPKQIADEIRRGSDPRIESSESPQRIPAVLHLWWAAWILTGFVGGVVARAAFTADTPGALRSADQFDIALSLFDVVAVVLAVTVVRRLTARQEQRRVALARLRGAAVASP